MINNNNKSFAEINLSSDEEPLTDSMLYEFWPGKNRFYLKGLLMTGSTEDKCKNYATWLFFIIIGSLHFMLNA